MGSVHVCPAAVRMCGLDDVLLILLALLFVGGAGSMLLLVCASTGWPMCETECTALLVVEEGGGGGTAATMDLTGTEEATTALTGCDCWEVTLMRLGGRSSSTSLVLLAGFSASSC